MLRPPSRIEDTMTLTNQTNRAGKGFTLIELLIVVAIIAILAAIAVPNFLEAQTRSKVSRCKADIRTLATAIESYAVDNNNKYPFDVDPRGWPYYITDVVSTPVAYITKASLMEDPFRVGGGTSTVTLSGRRFRYLNFPAELNPGWPPCYLPKPPAGPYHTRWFTVVDSDVKKGMETYGMWKISSSGPDKTANTTTATWWYEDLPYDPTNGTVSGGDIIRSQKMGQKS